MAALTLAFLLYEFRSIVILFILAILFSAAIRPPVLFLIERFNLSRSTATISIFILIAIITLLFIIVPSNALLTEVQTIFNDAAATYESRYPAWLEGSTLERTIAAELPPPDRLYETLIGPIFGQEIISLTSGLMSILGGAAVIIILSIYWTIDQNLLERYWLSLLSADKRVQARQIWRATEAGIGDYFRSEILQSILAALTLALIYWALGLQFPLILSGLAALAWLIPLLGALFAILPLLLVGLLYGSFGLSLAAALCTIVILSGLELIVEPRLFNRRRYNATTTVLLMLIFVEGFGLVGLIMAPPIAAALQIFFNHWVENISTAVTKESSVEVSLLQERFERMMSKQAQSKDALSPELESLTQRLAKLIDEANNLVTNSNN